MKKLRAAAMLLFSFSSSVLAIAPEQIRFVEEIDEGVCTFVAQETCGTGRAAGRAVCEKWHRKKAAKAGANRIRVATYESQTTPTINSYGFHMKSGTSMTADYFVCINESGNTTGKGSEPEDTK